MANQEGVKIVITAEDRFTETMKKIDAYTKIFGETAKNTERQIAALEKEMVRLVANGIDPASAKIQEMKASYDRLSQSLNNGSLKKTNQNFTALALVVQDLPYGFRGIQNNLPALLGGIAGVGGAAYLAFSAVIAVLTAVDSGLISFGNNIKLATDYNKEFASSLADEQVKLDSLYRTATNSNKSMSDRIAAAKKLKDEYPQLLSNFSAEEIAAGKAAKAYDKLSQAVIRYAKAEASQKAIKEIVTKQIENDIKIAEKELELKAANASADKRQTEIDKKSLVYAAGTINLERVRASTIQDTINKLKSQNKVLADQRKQYENIYDANVTFELDDVPKPTKEKKPKTKKEKQDIFDMLKATKEFYDAKLNFAEGDESAQRDILLRQKQTLDELIDGNQISWNDYFTNVSQIHKKLVDFQTKEDKRLLDSQTEAQKENVKNINAQLNATLKATRGNYEAQKSAIQNAINKNKEFRESAIKAGEGTKVFDDAIVNLENQLEGLVDPIEQLEIDFNTVINSLATGALVELGTQIGNVFTGVGFSIDGFLSIIADGLIKLGTYLVTISKLYLAIQALFASGGALAGWAIPIGLAAIAAGIALKSSLNKDSVPKFADGGIVSGPTLGLMGEYPGARSNPEVIAPLDKLKGLIGGGGGGTLTARISGNDLLILMNKASRTNSTTF